MKRLIVTVAATLLMTVSLGSVAMAAPNPSGTGLPSQSCQDIEAAGGTVPGKSSLSPGSPFNEPGLNSPNGGIGGQHYSEMSQYDVACYQVSQH